MNNDQKRSGEQLNQGGSKPGQQQGRDDQREREQQNQQGGKTGQQGGGSDPNRQPGGPAK